MNIFDKLDRLDLAIYDWVHFHRQPIILYSARDFTSLGGTTLAPLVAVVFASWHLVWLLVAATTINTVLKLIIGRPRPPFPDEQSKGASFPIPHTPSFPSGHSCASMVLYCGLAWEYGMPILYLVPPIVGITRVLLSAHWLTDVLAGLLLGALFHIVWRLY